MSESDGMDDALEGGMRQSLMIASRLAEAIARRIQEFQRQQQQELDRANVEARARFTAERSQAQAVLAPVQKDEWWNKAQSQDIAAAYATAEGWKAHDPAALAASEKIRQEVFTRYGIDTLYVGDDPAYLDSGIREMAAANARRDAMAASEETARKAAVEHERGMQLLAAARAEELRAQAQTLAPELERHQVPVDHLANPALAHALQNAHHAKTPAAREAADIEVKERMFLIDQDGINGPDIGKLREETAATINGAGEEHFKDPDFVKAAQELREARILAEGGFTGNTQSSMEQRYERAEKELFARMESFGRDIENRVTGEDSAQLKGQGLKAETTAAADYGAADRQAAFVDSLNSTGATEDQIRGRVAAERSEGTHPRAAVAKSIRAAKARKAGTGAAKGSERSKNGMSR